jgi:hypothetical protein
MLGKPHNTSYHSTAGLASLVAFCAFSASGLLGLHPDFGLLKTSSLVRTAHRLGGRAAAATSFAALASGTATTAGEQIHKYSRCKATFWNSCLWHPLLLRLPSPSISARPTRSLAAAFSCGPSAPPCPAPRPFYSWAACNTTYSSHIQSAPPPHLPTPNLCSAPLPTPSLTALAHSAGIPVAAALSLLLTGLAWALLTPPAGSKAGDASRHAV